MAEIARRNTAERRSRFRAFMAQLDGAGDPRAAIERGLYVNQPGGVADAIATRLELRPATTQLIVGEVGTGKTTQLLVARDKLVERLPGAIAIYLDVGVHRVPDTLKPGSVMALAGLQFAERFGREGKEVRSAFTSWAHGQWVHLEEAAMLDYEPDDVFVPGVVTTPNAQQDLKQRGEQLAAFLSAQTNGREVVLFIDSLDRLTDLAAFQMLMEQDIAALSSVGIGVVVVGPLRAVYGLDRAVADRFDNIHRQSPVVAAPDSDGLAFLIDVLRRRADPVILPEAACQRLVYFSGGVLRDLVQLAHQAGEEAYLAGAEHIGEGHVVRAADAFGRSLMMGLSSEDTDKLYKIHVFSNSVETSERDLALLATRRILDWSDGMRVRYRVHPTIAALLAHVLR